MVRPFYRSSNILLLLISLSLPFSELLPILAPLLRHLYYYYYYIQFTLFTVTMVRRDLTETSGAPPPRTSRNLSTPARNPRRNPPSPTEPNFGNLLSNLHTEEKTLVRQLEKNLYKTNSAESAINFNSTNDNICLLYTSPSPRDGLLSRMPSSA